MGVFQYGTEQMEYLKSRDRALGEVIEKLGHIEREVEPDLFAALVNSIVGQQISTKAQVTVWNRMKDGLGEVTPEQIEDCSLEKLQSFGISFRKAEYIKNAAKRVRTGELDIEGLQDKTDAEVCRELAGLKGVGVWTAEMLMTFSMQRPDIVSFGDLAIQRGLRMVYHHRVITPELFEKYRRRYSPCGTVASLYLWAVAGGAAEGMRDYAPAKKKAGKPKPYFWESFDTELGELTVMCDGGAVTQVSFGRPDFKSGQRGGSELLGRAVEEIQEYLRGERRAFDLPLNPSGTDFQKKVWRALCEIPYGETRSYKEIAAAAGNPSACRAVGMANNKNPIAILIPCHRVIGADGSLVGYGGGLDKKIKLLELEKKSPR